MKQVRVTIMLPWMLIQRARRAVQMFPPITLVQIIRAGVTRQLEHIERTTGKRITVASNRRVRLHAGRRKGT